MRNEQILSTESLMWSNWKQSFHSSAFSLPGFLLEIVQIKFLHNFFIDSRIDRYDNVAYFYKKLQQMDLIWKSGFEINLWAQKHNPPCKAQAPHGVVINEQIEKLFCPDNGNFNLFCSAAHWVRQSTQSLLALLEVNKEWRLPRNEISEILPGNCF